MAQTKPFTIRFSAGSVDIESGILRGVTVAEVGRATGHFVALDRNGHVLGVDDYDLPGTAKRLPLYMDAKGIDLIAAAGRAANRVKAREDHDDSIGARAGFADNFAVVDGKAVCDLKTLENYRNRALFLETAEKTPEMIGLSGEFRFDVEIIGDRAFMRVGQIDAVDIVDKGALTHAGLFRALPPVDTTEKTKNRGKFSNSSATMSNAPKIPPAGPDVDLDPDNDGDIDIPGMPDLDAFQTMCEQIGQYAAGLGKAHAGFADKLKQAMAAIQPVNVPTPDHAPAPVDGKPTNPDASVKDPHANFAALRAEFSAMLERERVTTARAVGNEFKRQFAALGLKPAAAPAPAPDSAPKQPDPAAPAADQPKTYLQMKAKIQKERNLKPGDAALAAMREHPALYADYQKGLGIYDPAKDPRNAAK